MAEVLIEKVEKLWKITAEIIIERRSYFQLLTDCRGTDYPLPTIKEEATGLRDHLLTTKKAITVKKVIR